MLILSCDWGTSSFRLHLAEADSERILLSRSASSGTRSVFQQWTSDQGRSRVSLFLDVLRGEILEMSNQLDRSLEEIPVLISGMASSSIGMKELPYAHLPFPVSGETAIVDQWPASDAFPWPVYLVSGLRSDLDVMRGEETQMIGLMEQIGRGKAVCILPGTHSKHIYMANRTIVDFRTFMTGELFEITGQHSILSNSLKPRGESTGTDRSAFLHGVRRAKASHYFNALFSVRTNALFEVYDAFQNFEYHSGLHIGYELKSLFEETPDTVVFICGGGSLSERYELAFQTLGLPNPLRRISAEEVELAALKGHLLLLRARS